MNALSFSWIGATLLTLLVVGYGCSGDDPGQGVTGPRGTIYASYYDNVCRPSSSEVGEVEPLPECSGDFGGTNPDINCSTASSSTGASCTRDCLVPCGFGRLGVKSCPCQGGTYTSCPCLKPASYMGAPTAPPCSEIADSGGSNNIQVLEPQGSRRPCDTLWQQCIGIDLTDPDNPNRGCVCLPGIDPNTLEFAEELGSVWDCGATNRWFSLAVP